MIRLVLLLLTLMTTMAAPAWAAETRLYAPVTDVRVCDGALSGIERPDFDLSLCRPAVFNQIDPQERLVWATGTVTLPPNATERPLGLYLTAMASSEVWWNGVKLGANGTPAASRAGERPGQFGAVFYVPPQLARPGDNTVRVRMSSHSQILSVARPVHALFAATYSDPLTGQAQRYLPALLTAGAFALAALYFGAAWATERRNLGPLWLAGLSLGAIGMLGAKAVRGFWDYAYVWQSPRLLVVVLFAALVGLSMAGYAAWTWRRRWWRGWIAATVVVMAGLCLAPGGFDQRALTALLVGAVSAAIAVGGEAFRRGPVFSRPRLTLAALVVFGGLAVAQGLTFLDRTAYLALGLLAIVLFADQLRGLRRAERERAEAQGRAARLELALVRRGIAPHFLLNTLNSLAEWVESDPKRGVRMIEVMGDEFRALSQMADRALVTLEEELALCRSHLELMGFRTDAPFELVVTGETAGTSVPPGLLLTLVENAFAHNRYPRGGVFRLTLEPARAGIRLTLTSPPAEGAAGTAVGTGTGMAYVRARLAEAWGEAVRIEDGPAADGGWRTRIEAGR